MITPLWTIFNSHRNQPTMLDCYLNLTHLLEGLREEHLYVQGSKDCIKLLKELGVLD